MGDQSRRGQDEVAVSADEEIVRDFLGDNPDSRQLREWRGALFQRLTGLRAERDELPEPDRKRRDRELRLLRKQILALDEEEAITRYVEESVRVTLAMGAVVQEIGEPMDFEE